MDSGKVPGAYTRPEVRRILGISENSLRPWERLGLTESKSSYSFADLISLKTLQNLRDNQIPAKRIREALHQLRLRLVNVNRPLHELKIYSDGRRIAVDMPGERMEALTGQMLFNFDAETIRTVATLGSDTSEPGDPEEEAKDAADASESLFRYALDLERSGAEPNEIIAVYRKVLDSNPRAAGAWVNMGTLHYRMRLLKSAERCYREALDANPEYALACFNLGNVCEETGRLDEAVLHYESALRFDPECADAHYNLALIQERRLVLSRAERHWRAYLEYDSKSPWADFAKRKLERLVRMLRSGHRRASE